MLNWKTTKKHGFILHKAKEIKYKNLKFSANIEVNTNNKKASRKHEYVTEEGTPKTGVRSVLTIGISVSAPNANELYAATRMRLFPRITIRRYLSGIFSRNQTILICEPYCAAKTTPAITIHGNVKTR